MKLFDHQEKNVGVLFKALADNGAALDGSEGGTGKTFTFLALCKKLNARPAVVTRLAVIPQWEAAAKEIGVNPLFITNYERLRSEKFPYTTLRRAGENVRDVSWADGLGRVIFGFDESQACRGKKTVNSLALMGAAAKYKTVLLSATPFEDPLQAYPQGKVLRLFNQSSYFRWQLEHGVRKDPFGHFKWLGYDKNHEEDGLEWMNKIRQSIFGAGKGVRTTRSAIPGFPESIVQVVDAETGEAGAIEAAYLRELEEARAGDLERMREKLAPELAEMAEPLPVTINLRARQEAELYKVRPIVELTQNALNTGDSVAIFVNFDATIEALSKLLDTKCIIRGHREGEVHTHRWACQNEFASNRQRVIIVNTLAGGAGLSLHDPVGKVSRTSIISPPWSAIALKQVLLRTQRLNGGFSTQKLVFAHGTIEEKVMHRVRLKLNCLDTLMDGDLDVFAQ